MPLRKSVKKATTRNWVKFMASCCLDHIVVSTKKVSVCLAKCEILKNPDDKGFKIKRNIL